MAQASLAKRLQEFIGTKGIVLARKRLLVAVSGGLDSMALVTLLQQMQVNFAIAHCNFQLRGVASDADEELVATTANKLGVSFFATRFETKEYAHEQGMGIQLAARKLRYDWLEQIRNQKKYDYIVTAHHLNDNVETIVNNFIKGTGLRGLRGMQVLKGKLFRPLLFATRQEIETYQIANTIVYREDESNAEDVYTRNKIRHHLIPLFEEINPGFSRRISEQSKVFADLEILHSKIIAQQQKQLFLKRGDDVYIPILLLKKVATNRTALFEYLKNYDFNATQVDSILLSLDSISGKQFFSSKARIIKDRQFLILTKNGAKKFTSILLEATDSSCLTTTGELQFETNSKEYFTIKKEKKYATVDSSLLEFPLVLRLWKSGDYFYPFGMQRKKKKLSKYFKDEKIRVDEKEKIWVLESNKKIVWVVGHRMDDRFRVTEKTVQVVQFHFIER